MATEQEFKKAAEEVKTLKSKPSNETLLQLYSLYKQASDGDVTGSRPGILDLKGRAKFDAWTALKGTQKNVAQDRYIKLVQELLKKN